MELGMINDDAYDMPIYVSGYPSYVDGVETSGSELYTGCGDLMAVYPGVIWYDTDSTAGDSGAPVYTKSYYRLGNNPQVNTLTVVGICSGSGTSSYYGTRNIGCRITAPVLQFYKQNDNIGGS